MDLIILRYLFGTQCRACPSIPSEVANLPALANGMKRQIAWIQPNESSKLTFGQVTCCFDDTCHTYNSSTISSEIDIDFSDFTLGENSTIDASLMEACSRNGYECTVIACNDFGCSNSSSAAQIVCPSNGFYTPSQITGDPEADGWFKIGDSGSLGTFVANLDGAPGITNFGVYMTSFVWDENLEPQNVFKGFRNFRTGDPVIGIGFVVTNRIDTKSFEFKFDTNGLGPFRPSTTTVLSHQDGVGDFTSAAFRVSSK